MNKYVVKFSVIFLLLTVSTGLSQVKPQITIGILGDRLNENYQEAILKLQNEIRAVVGEEATVSFGEVILNEFDFEKAKNNYRTLSQSNVDIILAFGLINNRAIYSEKVYNKPTIVIGAVNKDLLGMADERNTSNINNINYVISPISYTRDLDAFFTLYDFHSIGVVVDELLLQNLPLKEYFDTYFSDKTSSYKFIPIIEGQDISQLLVGLDAVYIAGGQYLSDAEFIRMLEAVNAKNLPSFSSFGVQDLKRGVLATNKPDSYLDNFMRRVALNIEAIIAGKNASELPLKLEYNEQLMINFDIANKIGFPIRYSAVGKVDFLNMSDEVEGINVKYSLVDIMSGVVQNNLSLSAERKEIDLSDQDVKIAKSSFLPIVTANADGLYVDPNLAEVSNGTYPELSAIASGQLQQTIYSAAAAANITISEKQLEAQKQSYNSIELDAILNASIAYFNALIYKTNVRIQNENLKTTRKNLEIARLNFEVGESSKYDELRFTSEVATNTQNFIDATKDYKQSLYTINQLMNNPIDFEIDIQQAAINEGLFKGYSYERFMALIDNPSLRPAFIAFLVEEAVKNSPELKNIGFSLEANDRYYRLNNGGRFIPTISLQGQYSLELGRGGAGVDYPASFGVPPDNTYNVGVNIALPLFQQNQRNINKQTSIIQKDQLDLYEQDAKLAIEKNINDIIADIMSRIANIEISKVSEEAAKEALSLTQSSYTEGESLLIELVDAQNSYLAAQLSSSAATYNYLLASMYLERAIGYFFILHSEEDNAEFIQRAQQYILEKKQN